jgi:hypothetical protein
MARRLVPLLLAVIVSISPIARELCGGFCAEPSPESAASPMHDHHGSGHATAEHDMGSHAAEAAKAHSASDTPASLHAKSQGRACCTPTLATVAVSHCNHDGEWQIVSTPGTKLALEAPQAVPCVVSDVGPPGAAASRSRLIAITPGSPIPLDLRTPLRV